MSDAPRKTPPASSFRQKVAEELIRRLEEGTAPWQHFVKPGLIKEPPFNPVSGTVYRGGNQMWLSMHDSYDPRWMTYNQAASVGAQVRKGARGVPIEFWKTHEQRVLRDEHGKPILGEDGKPQKATYELTRPIAQRFVVFNASQIDGLPPYKAPELSFDPIERAEGLLAGAGVPIHHDTQDRAFYRGGKVDEIHLPRREHFKDAAQYYATALHELGHATGHSSRLNRDLSGPFGSEKYAREELRAEISSLMVAQTLGIGHNPGNHAAYVASWIKVLKDDPNEIFRAARDAEVIQTWVLEPEKRQELHQRHASTKTQSVREAKGMEQSQDTPTATRVYLQVPFKEKDAAKAAGARWDKFVQKWYAPEGADMAALAQWQKQPETAATKSPEAAPADEVQQPTEKVWLAVPYQERLAAKQAGAKWDKAAKSWYAPEGTDRAALTPWLPIQAQAAPVERSPVEQFAEALAVHGLELKGAPVMDGQWHRVPVTGDRQGQLSGSYRGFLDGVANGQMVNFKQGGEAIQWTAASVAISPEQRAALAAEAAERAAARQSGLEAAHAAAARAAYGIWRNAPQWANRDNSPYLAAKNVHGYGVKVDAEGRLLVPLRDSDGHLHNLQTIGQRSEDGPGKTFLKNGRKTGLFHLIDPHKQAGKVPMVVAEGYATAAEVHQATGLPVAVAFDSGNLRPVAEALKAAWPQVPLMIAGDNDHHLENRPGQVNVGKVKATEAAQAVAGTLALPQLTTAQQAKGLTDWNDLAQDQGKAAVAAALAPLVATLRQQQGVRLQQDQQQAQTARQSKQAGQGMALGL
ncbi:zincin-like metallopeptidase domain-containing protein [Insolitispirillum peregrinum]|uniref:Antirestriction protein ArdC n=1 Tax=Insolitispirillum peregrinum TaxID=80876 RepID=A0A1N7MGC5_9PROT|nr:zincin-like metallopeptidase domain-containing protein [Insolitispirillum peregrinum]SIS85194.1 Antirestriction protein ArdC [Insolitispirillum peregrinum]